MAVSLLSSNGQIAYNLNEYVVDTPEDLEKLSPKALMGSYALCLSNSEVYVKDG
jgi:hypothetical protein